MKASGRDLQGWECSIITFIVLLNKEKHETENSILFVFTDIYVEPPFG